MLFYLFLLFTIVPLVELALLIWIGGQTAWWVPIVFVVFTGIAGAALARWQGWRALVRIQDEVRAGSVPADAIMDGFLVVVAAILLITPGVLTDIVGVSLLVPPLRSMVKRAAIASLRRRVKVQTAHFSQAYSSAGSYANTADRPHDEIVEAKVIRSHVEDAT